MTTSVNIVAPAEAQPPEACAPKDPAGVECFLALLGAALGRAARTAEDAPAIGRGMPALLDPQGKPLRARGEGETDGEIEGEIEGEIGPVASLLGGTCGDPSAGLAGPCVSAGIRAPVSPDTTGAGSAAEEAAQERSADDGDSSVRRSVEDGAQGLHACWTPADVAVPAATRAGSAGAAGDGVRAGRPDDGRPVAPVSVTNDPIKARTGAAATDGANAGQPSKGHWVARDAVGLRPGSTQALHLAPEAPAPGGGEEAQAEEVCAAGDVKAHAALGEPDEVLRMQGHGPGTAAVEHPRSACNEAPGAIEAGRPGPAADGSRGRSAPTGAPGHEIPPAPGEAGRRRGPGSESPDAELDREPSVGAHGRQATGAQRTAERISSSLRTARQEDAPNGTASSEARALEDKLASMTDVPRRAESPRHGGGATAPGTETAGSRAARKPQLVEQIVERARMVADRDGRTEVTIQLKPEFLGKLTMRLSWQSGRLNAQFLAGNPGVRDLLEQATPELREAFSNHGLELGQCAVGDFDGGGPAHARGDAAWTAGAQASGPEAPGEASALPGQRAGRATGLRPDSTVEWVA